MDEYVEQRDGGFWIAGKRISLDSVVYSFRRGESPESIQRSFPLLTLEEVYGAIAYYLKNEETIDAYLVADEAKYEEFEKNLRLGDVWYLRMQKAKQELLAPHV